ncbi:hypothetical protein Tco_1292086 [Tanacetum coccineum]
MRYMLSRDTDDGVDLYLIKWPVRIIVVTCIFQSSIDIPFSFGNGMDDELLGDPSFSHSRRCLWTPCHHSPFKRIKEWSNLVIRPKWKTFIRQFNKQRCVHGAFRYDPASYLLNFDEGPGLLEDDDDDDQMLRKFSMRYSSILVDMKPSALT